MSIEATAAEIRALVELAALEEQAESLPAETYRMMVEALQYIHAESGYYDSWFSKIKSCIILR